MTAVSLRGWVLFLAVCLVACQPARATFANEINGQVPSQLPGQTSGDARRWSRGPPTSPNYFPIGVWLQQPAYAARYRAIGINLYVGLWQGPTGAQLRALTAVGMQAVVAQNEAGLADASGTIVGWMQLDEPDNAQPDGTRGFGSPVPPAQVVARYREMKATDPTRPILLNLGQGVAWDGWHGRGTRTSHPEDYPEYLKGADIASFDIYPGASELPAVRGRFWLVPDGIERLRTWAPPGTAVWAVVETGNIVGAGAATPDQVRAQTWGAIVRGATGIVYFVHQFKPIFHDHLLLTNPIMATSVSDTNRRIRELAPVLNRPTIHGRARLEVVNSRARIDLMRKDLDGSAYLFAVNLDESGGDVAVAVDGVPPDGEAVVLGEDRRVQLSGGIFKDAVPAFGVRIYRVVGAVGAPDGRKTP